MAQELILALLDADDADHEPTVVIARQLASERRPSFITNYIEAEAHALSLRKLGRTLARQVVKARLRENRERAALKTRKTRTI